MTIHHLFGREDAYVIRSDRDGSRRASLHLPRTEASVEVSRRYSFGVGFVLGRNGGESDLGLDLHAGPVGSAWLRLRAPWTRWARVRPGQPDPYDVRSTGIRIAPHAGCLLQVTIEDRDGTWSRGQPWWRSMRVTVTTVLGRTRSERTVLASGATTVPMPEGDYPATWNREEMVTRYVRFPGTLLDRFRGPRTSRWMNLDIPGGIPTEGKGENSWDCGMDGVFSISGPDGTPTDTAERLVLSVLRDRARNGGPFNLTEPTSVRDAEVRP